MTLPNGMYTGYAYDARGRMTSIAHKTGSAGSTLESYGYTMDKAGLIGRIDQVDSSYWTYTYDTRYRLTGAVRHNASDTIKANYAYTYDDGDNLVTKVEPWTDDFTDGSITDDGWTVYSGTWAVTNGAAQNTSSSSVAPTLQLSVADDDYELRYSYRFDSVQAGTPQVEAQVRKGTTNFLDVVFYPTKAEIWKYDGTWTLLHQNTSVSTATGTLYDVRVQLDGASLKVLRSTGGGLETTVFNVGSMPTYDGTRIQFIVNTNMVASIDNVMAIADDLSRSTTLGVNVANELSSFADYNGTTSYAYDELGRMTTKTRGSSAASYAWHLDDRLMQVNSNFPGEGVVDYNYGADGYRRTRTFSSTTTTYNWARVDITSQENSSGTITQSYVDGNLAHIDGSTPSSGTYAYHNHDSLSSSRAEYDGSKALNTSSEYEPFGGVFNATGGSAQAYTGLWWDEKAGLYLTSFRAYSPEAQRWLSRDPLYMASGPNLYAYVGNDPVNFRDPLGLTSLMGCAKAVFACAGGAMGEMTPAAARRAAARAAAGTGRLVRSPLGGGAIGGGTAGAGGQVMNGCGVGSALRGAGLGALVGGTLGPVATSGSPGANAVMGGLIGAGLGALGGDGQNVIGYGALGTVAALGSPYLSGWAAASSALGSAISATRGGPSPCL